MAWRIINYLQPIASRSMQDSGVGIAVLANGSGFLHVPVCETESAPFN